MKSIYKFLIFSTILLVSCSKYEKLLKSTDSELKYRKAIELYNNEDYIKASTLFEQIAFAFRGSNKSDSVAWYLAMSFYKQGDYITAGESFKDLSKTYQRSIFVEESEYLYGYCFYLISPRPSLDQESTVAGIDAFKYFMYKYPESKYVADCKRLILELQNKLIEKQYANAKLYFNLGEHNPIYYKASVIALRNCIANYPDTKYREEIMFMILQSNYFFAQKSVVNKQKERYQTTMDEYYSFQSEFPESKYTEKANKIYSNSKEFLGL